MNPLPDTNRWRTVAWTAVRLLLGVLLLTAAGLKLAGHSVSAVPQVGWFTLPTVQIAAAEWEIVLGLWLLSGVYPIGSWLAALATFASFAVVSGYLGWIGVATCGCLGTIRTSPWYTLALDGGAVLVLSLFRPVLVALRMMTGRERCRILVGGVASVLGAAGLLAGATGAATMVYGSPGALLARLRGDSVFATPSHVDFGVGDRGERLFATVEVRNLSNHPIRLVGGTSDCSCVTSAGMPRTIPPGEACLIPIEMTMVGKGNGVFTRLAVLWTDDDSQRMVALSLSGRAR